MQHDATLIGLVALSVTWRARRACCLGAVRAREGRLGDQEPGCARRRDTCRVAVTELCLM